MRSALRSLRDLRDRAQDLPDALRVMGRVAKQTGMLWELSLPAVRVGAGALLGTPNPALVYRIAGVRKPDAVALYWHDEALSFQEVDRRVDRLAGGLRKGGLGGGTSLVLLMKNRPEFLLGQAGAGRIGAAAVSVSWRST